MVSMRVTNNPNKTIRNKDRRTVLRNQVLPILKKQPGFLEILPFEPETKMAKTICITLWTEKRDAERYEREAYAKVEGVVKPYLTTPVTCKHYKCGSLALPAFRRGPDGLKNRPEGPGRSSAAAPAFRERLPGTLSAESRIKPWGIRCYLRDPAHMGPYRVSWP
jgi:hypothetical protein